MCKIYHVFLFQHSWKYPEYLIVSAIMSNCACKLQWSHLQEQFGTRISSVIWQTCVTDTWCRKAALYMFHLCTHAEWGMICACKLNPPSPLTPRVAVLPRRKGNISQAEHVFTALRHSWRHGWGKGCCWKAYAINYSPEMGLDCMARAHALQQIARETSILAWTGEKAGIVPPVSASYSKHRNQILKKENERSP